MSFEFVVYGPPQGKARHRTTKTGHVYTPAKTLKYEADVKAAFLERYAGEKPLDGPVYIRICAEFEIPKSFSKARQAACIRGDELPCKRPDIDNIEKIIMDPLKGLAWKDDTQVVRTDASKTYARDAKVRVYISKY